MAGKNEKELAAALTRFFAAPVKEEAFGLTLFPSLSLFAAARGEPEDRLRALAARGGPFGRALAAGEARVRELRIAAAEQGKCNAAFEKFVLSALYGMKEGEKPPEEAEKNLKVEIVVAE